MTLNKLFKTAVQAVTLSALIMGIITPDYITLALSGFLLGFLHLQGRMV